MDEKIKQILKAIGATTPDNTRRFGDILTGILFKRKESALYVSGEDTYFLYSDNFSENEAHTEMFRMMQLCYLLDELSKEGVVILVDNDDEVSEWVYYQGASEFRNGSLNGEYLIGKDMSISVYKKEGMAELYDDGVKMTSISFDRSSAMNVSLMMRRIVYPTLEFPKYQSREFTTASEYSLKQSLRANCISMAMMVIAIITATVSPVIQHHCVRSTINDDQFNQIISVHRSDTTNSSKASKTKPQYYNPSQTKDKNDTRNHSK